MSSWKKALGASAAGTWFGTIAMFSGCAGTQTEKSTGTNWLRCEDDADCRSVPDALCSDHVCVDVDGHRIISSGIEVDPASGGRGGGGRASVPETDAGPDAGGNTSKRDGGRGARTDAGTGAGGTATDSGSVCLAPAVRATICVACGPIAGCAREMDTCATPCVMNRDCAPSQICDPVARACTAFCPD